MKVRFLGVQQWIPQGGQPSHKVFYSTRNDKQGEKVKLDDGSENNLSFYGEKPIDLKLTQEGFDELSQIKPGSVVMLELTPNPLNPRFNVCTGGKAA